MDTEHLVCRRVWLAQKLWAMLARVIEDIGSDHCISEKFLDWMLLSTKHVSCGMWTGQLSKHQTIFCHVGTAFP